MSTPAPVLILDYGSQYTQLIARKIRELQIYCLIVPHSISAAEITAHKASAIILSGGPASVYAPEAPGLDAAILQLSLPILGICYGMHLVITMLGGAVERIPSSREYGNSALQVSEGQVLFDGIPAASTVWMSHGDSVKDLPEGFSTIARSSNAIAAAANPESKIYLVQFHPEVKHSEYGMQMLENFLFKAAGLSTNWTMSSFIASTIEDVRARVGDKEVVCAVSGGVDSSVMAVILHKALGPQLRCIFVDNGLLRKDERIHVERRFKEHFLMDVHIVDARARFVNALKGVTEPEKKRAIIGNTFLEVFFEHAGSFDFLAQGTLYPDVIESGGTQGGPAAVIKTHHNRVAAIHKLIEEGKVIEPFQELFKDEVRLLGDELGMPKELVYRQPFPGPGLAIRVIGEIDEDRLEILRLADDIIVHEMKEAGLYFTTWQSFAVLLPIRSVGVMGDERTYGYVIAMRSVESSDGMTSHITPLPFPLLEKISNRIINEVDGVNRVVYDISSKPPATIEWE